MGYRSGCQRDDSLRSGFKPWIRLEFCRQSNEYWFGDAGQWKFIPCPRALRMGGDQRGNARLGVCRQAPFRSGPPINFNSTTFFPNTRQVATPAGHFAFLGEEKSSLLNRQPATRAQSAPPTLAGSCTAVAERSADTAFRLPTDKRIHKTHHHVFMVGSAVHCAPALR